jgi:formate hydrogenlyase subunit 6/NADH:ubiquinone oxidoreductase subunit I
MSDLKGIYQGNVKISSRRPEGKISRRELFKLASPLGKVMLDSSKCTGCGLCAIECTTGALSFSSSVKADVYQLLFKHNLCVACGQCVEVCPEQCLVLERILDLSQIKGTPVVLFEDSIARCRQCGGVVGSAAMIARLRAKLANRGDLLTSQLELCPRCKAEARLIRR